MLSSQFPYQFVVPRGGQCVTWLRGRCSHMLQHRGSRGDCTCSIWRICRWARLPMTAFFPEKLKKGDTAMKWAKSEGQTHLFKLLFQGRDLHKNSSPDTIQFLFIGSCCSKGAVSSLMNSKGFWFVCFFNLISVPSEVIASPAPSLVFQIKLGREKKNISRRHNANSFLLAKLDIKGTKTILIKQHLLLASSFLIICL